MAFQCGHRAHGATTFRRRRSAIHRRKFGHFAYQFRRPAPGRGRYGSVTGSKRGAAYLKIAKEADDYSMQQYGKHFNMAQAQADYDYAKNTQTQNTLKMIKGMTEKGGAIDIAQMQRRICRSSIRRPSTRFSTRQKRSSEVRRNQLPYRDAGTCRRILQSHGRRGEFRHRPRSSVKHPQGRVLQGAIVRRDRHHAPRHRARKKALVGTTDTC